MLRGLKTKVFYPYSPQQVWRGLTERRSLATWLMDNDFEPHIGHKFQFRTHSLPGLDGVICCEVLEIDPPKRLSYTWQDSYMSQPSIVTWTLTPVDGGTQLQLEHRELNYATPQLQEVRTCNQRSRSSLDPINKGGTDAPFSRGLRDFDAVTQAVEAIAPSSPFLPTHTGVVQILESVILHSLLNGGWNDKLDRLPNVLASFFDSKE
ncbi:SRPBCC domain-containing protein [Chroococcidiopsis sp. FACHB-1243]|uniref:SRPBCC family protein n=1 Tax=Chroococcidiopsis sp. [FACHB-1243] TaxID=2692781 RepID=UPI00177F62A7|nr:SRPBCC domain-containing protein [Chroococcidiopsis sp. [FACHB-1243]]MBD2306076.1 SRPBCC domain-containing protein [Chroococcidiopsis sp. [FACHB-1243]]